MAGGGVDAAAYTGGRALSPESLQGAKREDAEKIVDILPDLGASHEQLVRFFKSFIPALKKGNIRDYHHTMGMILDHGIEGGVASNLINYLAKTLPGLVKVH